jgi:hypothetical protein
MTRLGTFTNTASEAAGWGVPTQRFTHVDTRVVRRKVGRLQDTEHPSEPICLSGLLRAFSRLAVYQAT